MRFCLRCLQTTSLLCPPCLESWSLGSRPAMCFRPTTLQHRSLLIIVANLFRVLTVFSGEGNGTPFQYSCLEKSHGQRSLVGCSPWGREESDTTEWLHFYFSLSCIGEGNGNPLHCSCLENPRDRGAWSAAVYGVAQSRTRLKWLSSSSSSSSMIFSRFIRIVACMFSLYQYFVYFYCQVIFHYMDILHLVYTSIGC